MYIMHVYPPPNIIFKNLKSGPENGLEAEKEEKAVLLEVRVTKLSWVREGMC